MLRAESVEVVFDVIVGPDCGGLIEGRSRSLEFARMAMVQPTDPEKCDDLSHFSGLDRPLFWSVLFQPKVSSIRVAIVSVRPDHAPMLALVDCYHMVQTISS